MILFFILYIYTIYVYDSKTFNAMAFEFLKLFSFSWHVQGYHIPTVTDHRWQVVMIFN